jgi:type I restriction enzyme S subunit
MSEWKSDELENLLDTLIDYRGKTPKKTDSGIPLITAKIIKGGTILPYNEYIAEDDYDSWMVRGFPKSGDVVLTTEAPLGEVAQLDDTKIALAQRVVCLRGKNGVLDNKYLKYYFMSKKGHQALCSRESGTTVTGIKQSELRKVKVTFPPFEVQKKIASVISSFDDKIAVNHRICENLEAQAQALFKSWFIDFEPFKNGKFVESELGMIPEGWKIGNYDEIINEIISGDWGKDTNEGNYNHKVACVRGCDFQDVKMGLRGKTPERFILEKNYALKHFMDKDILVEISGGTATVSTGRVCPVSQLLIDKYNGDIVCTNFCRLVRPKAGYSSYLYYSWKYKYDRKVMFGYENGTSGIKNFSIKDFITKELLVIPSLTDIKEFESLINHIHTQLQYFGSESARLAELRDTLLPKLMSGQITL